MDYTIIYIIGVCVSSALIGVVVTYIMKKYKLDQKDISNGIDLTQSIVVFVKATLQDMRFGNNDDIEMVTDIVIDTLHYIKAVPVEMSKDEKILQASNYAIDLCGQIKIELNDERKQIIGVVITLLYNFVNSVENKIGEA